jgi:hypothetical protein
MVTGAGYGFDGQRITGEKESRVKIPRGPAAVKAEFSILRHWETGKVWRVMMLEPEDLPVIAEYPTYER